VWFGRTGDLWYRGGFGAAGGVVGPSREVLARFRSSSESPRPFWYVQVVFGSECVNSRLLRSLARTALWVNEADSQLPRAIDGLYHCVLLFGLRLHLKFLLYTSIPRRHQCGLSKSHCSEYRDRSVCVFGVFLAPFSKLEQVVNAHKASLAGTIRI